MSKYRVLTNKNLYNVSSPAHFDKKMNKGRKTDTKIIAIVKLNSKKGKWERISQKDFFRRKR